jgi:glycosyltransferase involved in cell wall biosynthesis
VARVGKVLFWTPDDGGSRLFRCDLPAQALKARGHEAEVSSVVFASWAQGATIVAQRPFNDTALKRIRFMNQLGVRVLLDWDDDHLNIDPEAAPNTYAQYLQPSMRNSVVAAIQECAGVVVASPVLAERASVLGAQHIYLVPNGLPAKMLSHPGGDFGDTGGRTVFGWAGTESTAAEFRAFEPVIRQFLRARQKQDDVVLRTVGLNPEWVFHRLLDQRGGVQEHQVQAVGWLHDYDDYLSVCSTFDVWLAPYRDVPFNQAKYPTKALEAAFLGIPIVASDIRPYRWALGGPQPRGFLILNDEDRWTRVMRNMVRQPQRHAHLVRNAQAWAAHQITESLVADWEAALWPSQ